MNLNDIVQGCIKQERIAQNKLYEYYYGKMMCVCMRYTSDRDEAKEILNNGFFKVFKSLEQFKNEAGNLDGWIYRIMVNTAIDFYRKDFKHKNTEEVPAYVHSNEADVLSQLSADEILQLVQKLSPAYRTVFNLYVVEGFSHNEISEKLGISVGSTKSNLAKARMRLQEMIKEKYNYHKV